MGAYIYSLLSKIGKISINGRITSVGMLKYSHKPRSTFWGEKNPRWQVLAQARIARQEKIWNERGFTPEYVVIVGDNNRIEENCGVLNWHSNGCSMAVSTYDDPDWGGRKFLGYLNKNLELNIESK